MFDLKFKQLNSSIEINGKLYNQQGAEFVKKSKKNITLVFAGMLSWDFTLEEVKGGQIISGKLKNISDSKILIGKLSPLKIQEMSLSGNSSYFYWGGLNTNYVYDIKHPLPEVPVKPFLLFNDKTFKKSAIISCISFDQIRSDFIFEYEKSECSMFFDYKSFELKPGMLLTLEKLFIKQASDPFELLDDWADEVRDYYKINLSEEIPVGWVGWSWVDSFKTLNTEIVTRRNIKAVTQKLSGLGVRYIWNSICQLEGGLPGNWREFDKNNFPSGYENIVREIEKNKLAAGFWCGAFYNCETSHDFEQNKDYFFKDNDGNIVYWFQWLWAYNAPENSRPRLCYLDSTHPETEKYLRKLFSDLHTLGIRYYMLDFLDAGLPRDEYDLHDKSMVKDIAGYRKCMKAIREAAADDTYLLTAVGSGMQNVGLVDSTRIGADYGEGRQLMPRFASYPATFVINGSLGSAGNPNRNAIQNLAAAAHMDRKLFNINSNLLTVDKPLGRNEALVSLNLFAISGSPVMFGDDLDIIDDERMKMLKKILPRIHGAPKAVDMFEKVYPEHEYSQIFQQKITTTWGQWDVVALFNLEESFQDIELDFAKLELEENTEYRVWEFWDSKYLGLFKNKCKVQLPAQSSMLLAVRKSEQHPALLATDMHCRMGQVDLEDVKWDMDTSVLSGTAKRPEKETGNIFIIAPYGWKPLDYEGLFVAKDGRDESLIIRKSIDFAAGGSIRWSVAFAELSSEERTWKEKGK